MTSKSIVHRMKILHLCRLYYPSIGGTEHCIRMLSEWLVARGHTLQVVTSQAGSEIELHDAERVVKLSRRDTLADVHIKRLPVAFGFRHFLLNTLPSTRLLWRIPCRYQDIWHFLQRGPILRGLLVAILTFRPHVMLIVSSYGPLLFFSLLAQKLYRCPLLVMPCLHTTERWAQYPILYRWINRCDAVLAFTDFEKKTLVEHGVEDEKIIVTGLGVEMEIPTKEQMSELRKKYHIYDTKPVIMCMGRIVAYKGVGAVIQAMEKIWQNGQDAILVLAGSTRDDSDWIEKYKSRDYMFSKNIRWVLDFPDTEKNALLSCCDLLALPSKCESFGLVYIEAWAMHKPVLAAPESAAASYIEHEINGLLVSPDDPKSMVKALTYILEHPNQAVSMGEAGYQRWHKRYRWSEIGVNIERIYENLAFGV